MTEYELRGIEIRGLAKSLILQFMQATPACQLGKSGLKMGQIFKECGFDWGDQKKNNFVSSTVLGMRINSELRSRRKS